VLAPADSLPATPLAGSGTPPKIPAGIAVHHAFRRQVVIIILHYAD
jgi:hypothetical protein